MCTSTNTKHLGLTNNKIYYRKKGGFDVMSVYFNNENTIDI